MKHMLKNMHDRNRISTKFNNQIVGRTSTINKGIWVIFLHIRIWSQIEQIIPGFSIKTTQPSFSDFQSHLLLI